MILFYNKQTGNIIGTIDGRIHSEDHLKMWVGKKEETERIICQWKPVKWFDKNGKEVDKDATDPKTSQKLAVSVDYEPDSEQKDVFYQLDQKPSSISEYKVDLKTKHLIKKQ